jgi:hypothetical protein
MNATEIIRKASEIAGACWDDRSPIGSLADQLRACAATPALGSGGDLTEDDRRTLLALADEVEQWVGKEAKRKVRNARARIARKARSEALDSIGVKKVRGAMGGTYYE